MPHTGGHDIGPTHMLVSISTFLANLCDVPPVGAVAVSPRRSASDIPEGRCVYTQHAHVQTHSFPLAHSPSRPLAHLHSPARTTTHPHLSLSERLFPRDSEDGEEDKGAAGGLDPPTAEARPASKQEENAPVPAATS